MSESQRSENKPTDTSPAGNDQQVDPDWRASFLEHRHQFDDPEENRKTSPPSDERIVVQCIWVTEFYAPSHVPQLISGFKSLGLRPSAANNEGIEEYLTRLRARQYGTQYNALGPLMRHEDERWSYIPDRNSVELPEEVDYAFGRLDVVSPSLTALTIQFVLTEEAARLPEKALRRTDFSTHEEVDGDSSTFHSPLQKKSEAVFEAKQQLRKACASWFADHVPGAFHNTPSESGFPVLELITLLKAHPFEPFPSDDLFHLQSNYLKLLDLEEGYGIWSSPSLPGMYLRLPHGGLGTEEFSLSLAANEHEMLEGVKKSQTSLSRALGSTQPDVDEVIEPRFTKDLDHELSGLTMIWSLNALIASYEVRLASYRDEAGTIDVDKIESAANHARRLQRQLVETSRDTTTLTSELLKLSENSQYFERHSPRSLFRADAIGRARRNSTTSSTEYKTWMKALRKAFATSPLRRFSKSPPSQSDQERDESPTFAETISATIRMRCARVQEIEPAVERVIDANVSLASALVQSKATEENMNLQKRTTKLTRRSFWVAILATIAAVLQAAGFGYELWFQEDSSNPTPSQEADSEPQS